jgi:hypothetical protein
MSADSWNLSGVMVESCSCNVGCPCTFAQDPTHGWCKGNASWHIEQGKYGNVDLDGLNVILINHSPGNILKGNWSVGLVIDSKANAQQREALQKIFTGKAGGFLSKIALLFSKFLGVEYAPIDTGSDGKNWHIKVGDGKLDVESGWFKSPLATEPLPIQIVNPPVSEAGPGATITMGQASKSRNNGISGTLGTLMVEAARQLPSNGRDPKMAFRH